MKKIIPFLLILFLGSCVITQHLHFNKDGGGHLRYRIDLKNLMTALDGLKELEGLGSDSLLTGGAPEPSEISEESSEEDSTNMLQDMSASTMEMVELLKEKSGIKNVRQEVNWDSSYIEIHLDFENINALQEMLSGDILMNNTATLSYKGKKFSVKNLPTPDSEKTNGENLDLNTDDPLTAGLQSFSINYIYSFERKIKSHKGNYQKGPYENSLIYSGEYSVISKDPSMIDLSVKLK